MKLSNIFLTCSKFSLPWRASLFPLWSGSGNGSMSGLLSTVILGTSLLLTNLHEFHLSKTDIHYKTEAQALQVTIHIFIDDTESALQDRQPMDYKLMQDSEHVLADSVLGTYFKENFIIKVDGEQQTFEYLGKEASDDIEGLYAYLEIPNLETPKELEITNKLLMEKFDDQKNIIKVMMDKKNKAFHLLTNKDHTKIINF